MFPLKEKFALQSIRSKVLITFLFGCAVAFLSWFVARFVFEETFSTIEAIAQPNPRLQLINRIFHQIHRFDQTQKQHQAGNSVDERPEDYELLHRESEGVYNSLDSLRSDMNDSVQLRRLDRMQRILRERETMYNNYLRFRASDPLSKDMQRLSIWVEKSRPTADSVLRTTTTKVTTEVVPIEQKTEAPKKESFFRRVFGRKKEKPAPQSLGKRIVTEDVQLSLDTLAVSRRDSFVKEMKQVILDIERKQLVKGLNLLDQEQKLNAAMSVFMDELQQLLQQVQQDEINNTETVTGSLSAVFSKAFERIGIILAVFFVISIVLILLIFSDISQSNKVRLQLIEARKRAEQLEQAKHRFLANMSHEIRTPLQSIIGYAEQLKQQSNNSSVDAVYASSRHLLHIVNEVLDYSRIISGHFVFEKEDFNMSALLAEVCDVVQGQADEKQIGFRLHFSPSDPSAIYSGDAFRLKQILYNLLGNAVKFTSQGEVTLRVTEESSDNQDSQFCFEVHDTGIGIDGEDLKHIFRSFEQGAGSTQRLYGGTGLGLSIAQSLAEQQGGSLEARSEKGKGSVFTLCLSYPSGQEKAEEQVLTEAGEFHFEGQVVLVDDDPFITGLCETIFRKHHIAHTIYNSPLEAAELQWNNAHRVVLMDQRMPSMSGTQLLKILKATAPSGVRFISLTAHALPEERMTMLASGFDQVLLKPFTESDLLHALNGSGVGGRSEPVSSDNFSSGDIVRMCAGDLPLIHRTLSLFLEQGRLDLNLLNEGFEKENTDLVAQGAHRLSAGVGQFGMRQTAWKLRQTEQSAIKGDLSGINRSELIKAVHDTLLRVESELEKIS